MVSVSHKYHHLNLKLIGDSSNYKNSEIYMNIYNKGTLVNPAVGKGGEASGQPPPYSTRKDIPNKYNISVAGKNIML